MIKKIINISLYIAFLSVFFVISLEILIRIFFSGHYKTYDDVVNYKRYIVDNQASRGSRMFEKSPHYGFKLRDNMAIHIEDRLYDVAFTLTTNSRGFRFSDEKWTQQDKIKIMMLGDSVTMGYGVDDSESYPEQLQSLLGDRFNVFNFGVSAWGPPEEIITFNRFKKQINPDLVILGIFPQNDFGDIMGSNWAGKTMGQLPDTLLIRNNITIREGDAVGTTAPLKYSIPILRNSYAFIFLMEEVVPYLRTFVLLNFFSQSGLVHDASRSFGMNLGEIVPEDILVQMVKHIDEQASGTTMVLFFPSLRSYAIHYTPDSVIQSLKTTCPDVHVIDFFPVFEDTFKDLTVDGSHLNPEGNRQVAEIIHEYLLKQTIIQTLDE